MFFKKSWAASLVIAALVGSTGCGGGGTTVSTVPASGTVTLDGAPVDGARLTFMPNTGGPDKIGYAVTDAQGQFEATTRGGAPGLAVGSYRVLVEKLALPDGSPIPPDAMAADVGAKNILPPLYANSDESPLSAAIADGGTSELKLELASRPRR